MNTIQSTKEVVSGNKGSGSTPILPGKESHSSANFLKDDFHQKFRQKALDHDSFHKMMQQSFSDGKKTGSNKGTTYNYKDAEALRQKVLADDLSWLPEVKVLSASEFSEAQLFHQGQASGSKSFLGAFGDDTIFLNESILSDPDLAERVYSEEAGHAIDKLLNNERDTQGDEGAIFSKLLMGKSLSAEQMQALKVENDHGKLAGVDVEFLSDSDIISQINSSRTEAYNKKVEAAREEGKNDGKNASEIEEEISKIEKPQPLTAAEEKDASYIYKSAKAYGKSDEEAAAFTIDLMKPENASIRAELHETQAHWAVGQTLVETVEHIGAKNDLHAISGGLHIAIEALESANTIDVPGREASLMVLNSAKGAIDTLLAYAEADSSAVGFSKALTVSGKTVTQLLKDINQGDFVALSEVMTYAGETWGKFIETNDNLKEWAAGTQFVGNSAISVGRATGNTELVLFGEITLGASSFLGAWDEEKEGKPVATKFTRAGDGLTFVGNSFSAIGKYTGDKWLSDTGSYITEGAKLLGPINTLNKLINNDDLEPGTFANASLPGVGQFATTGLNLAAMVVGGETGKDLKTASTIINDHHTLYAAITSENPSNATIAAASINGFMHILEAAGVEIDPKMQKLVSSLVSGLSSLSNKAADQGAGAAVQFVAPYIVDFAGSLGVNLTEKGVTEALGTIGTYAGIVIAAVKVGFEIAEIAENDDLDDQTKITRSLYAVSDAVLFASLSTLNPVGLIAAAGINIGASIGDMIDNGVNRENHDALVGGLVARILFPPRTPNAWFSTAVFDPSAPPLSHDNQTALDKGVLGDDGILAHTGGGHGGNGNRDAFLRIDTPFGTNAISMHEFERDLDPTERYEKMEVFRPLLKQMETTDNNLAMAFNLADENNGEAGATMAGYHSAAVGNPIKLHHDVEELNLTDLVDKRYETITDRVASSNTKAGQAFNAWVDGIGEKMIDSSGDTIAIVDIIAKAPAVLQMSPEVIERILNTVEPGSAKHVMTQLINTVGTYVNALSNPLVQGDSPMDEQQTLDFVIEKLGLTQDYRFAVAGSSGIPQNIKDFVAHLNEMGGHGEVKLMGQGVQMGQDPEKNYQLVVDGELDAYRFVDGDTPHFVKMSRAIIDLSGDYGDWPPSNTVNWGDHQFQASRGGDLQWVRPAEGEDETRGLVKAQEIVDQLQAKGKDVKLLGLSTTDGLFEVLVEGKQHAYKLDGDRFTQVSQRNLQTDIPKDVQKFHADLNRLRVKEGNEAVKLVGRSEDGKAYQLIVNGEQDAYRYVEDIEYEYAEDSTIATKIDNSYYEKVSRTTVTLNGEWPPSNTVNWSDPEFQATREGNLIQWVKPDNTLSEQERNGLTIAQTVTDQLQANGKDVKLLGVSNAKGDLFEVLVEGKQHAYKLEGDSFVQVTQTTLFAKASPTPEDPAAPTTALPLADGNAAFMAGNYQGIIDYVDQNPSSGTDQQILDTYKRAAQIGLTLEEPMAQADYKTAAPIFESLANELNDVAPELAKHYSVSASLASQANLIISFVLSSDYNLANSVAKTFLATMEASPGQAETFGPAMALANNVVAISDSYAAGNFTEAAKRAEDYAETIPADHPLKAEFNKIAENIRGEEVTAALIAEGNAALWASNYDGIIDYMEANPSDDKAVNNVYKTYKQAALHGIDLRQAMDDGDYSKAATAFTSLSTVLKNVVPELASHYSIGATLANQANSIITSVLSSDYTQANSAAKTFLATLDANPGREEEFGSVMPLARNVVAISNSYASGNLVEAAQLAAAYAETIPASDPLKAEFTKIAEDIRGEQATAA